MVHMSTRTRLSCGTRAWRGALCSVIIIIECHGCMGVSVYGCTYICICNITCSRMFYNESVLIKESGQFFVRVLLS